MLEKGNLYISASIKILCKQMNQRFRIITNTQYKYNNIHIQFDVSFLTLIRARTHPAYLELLQA